MGAAITALFGAVLTVLAVLFLPFVLLGQIVYGLAFSREGRVPVWLSRKSVFQDHRDRVVEGVLLYGVALISAALTIWVLLGASGDAGTERRIQRTRSQRPGLSERFGTRPVPG